MALISDDVWGMACRMENDVGSNFATATPTSIVSHPLCDRNIWANANNSNVAAAAITTPAPDYGKQMTYARNNSVDGMSQNSCEIPADTFSMRALLCAAPVQYQKSYTGECVTTAVHIMRLNREETMNEAGTHFQMKVKRPKFPFKLSLDEAEELCIKLPYLLRAIKSAPGVGREELCAHARGAYIYDTRSHLPQTPIMFNSQPSTGSQGSEYGPTNAKRLR